MHDSGMGKYLENASESPLSGSKGLGVYLEPRDSTTAEKPHEANYDRVYSDEFSGGIGRYLQDGTK